VVGINDELTGQAVNAFVALKDGTESSDQVKKDLILQVRKSIGPFAAPKAIFVVPDLPKTRSGKIMRRIMRKILAGEEDQLGDITTVSAGVSCRRVVTRWCLVDKVLTRLGAALGSVGSGEDYRHCAPGQAQEIAAGGVVGRRRSGAGVGDMCPAGVWNHDDAFVVLSCIVAGPGLDMARFGIGSSIRSSKCCTRTRTHEPTPLAPFSPLPRLSTDKRVVDEVMCRCSRARLCACMARRWLTLAGETASV
jgi:hypothetical protein